jgi:hypothetical protein
MTKYKRLTIDVTAEQYNGPEFIEYESCSNPGPEGTYWFYVDILKQFYPFVDGGPANFPLDVKTGFIVAPTDWIITKQDGERIVVSDDEFKREYEQTQEKDE